MYLVYNFDYQPVLYQTETEAHILEPVVPIGYDEHNPMNPFELRSYNYDEVDTNKISITITPRTMWHMKMSLIFIFVDFKYVKSSVSGNLIDNNGEKHEIRDAYTLFFHRQQVSP